MPASDFPGADEALEQLRPILLALPAAEIGAVRADVPQAVSNLLKVANAYAEERPLFVATFTPVAFDAAAFDNVGTRAKALWQADVLWRQRVDAEEKLPGLVSEGGVLKKKLLRAAVYLWEEDPQAGPHVAAIRSGHGYVDLADDLVSLANLFDGRWSEAQDLTHVTKDDLRRARTIGAEIAALAGAGARDETAESLRDLRMRAFHYAHSGAEEIRLAAAYLHRHRPDRLAAYPSAFFHPGGGRPQPKKADADAPSPAPARTLEPVDG